MNATSRLVLAATLALTLGACASRDQRAQPISDATRVETAATGHFMAQPRQTATAAPMLPTATAVPPTAELIIPTAEPIPPTAEPIVPTAEPIPPTAEPIIPTAEPIPPTAEPIIPTAGLIVPTAEPILTTIDPVAVAAARRPDRIIIASIALDRSLVEVGLDANHTPVVPEYDVAWYQRSAQPGTGENVVIWGHALRFSNTPEVPAPLERLKEASIGDTVTIVTADGSSYTYVIREQIWVLPNQVHYILPRGKELLTIVNCIGDVIMGGDGQLTMTHRLITVAEPAW